MVRDINILAFPHQMAELILSANKIEDHLMMIYL